ncbi:sensor histidine kinase [Dokdonella sp.]|uniref:sensor histidine kinase n=1 Tax=Dokdonella sp. TaxID=2291710 RepID=UPI003C483B8C
MSLYIAFFVACGVSMALGIVAIALALLLRKERTQLAAEQAAAASRLSEREALIRAQATMAERERIYGDLHDDIGARLLGMIHAAESPEQADRARAVLQDLRDVVTRSRGTPGSLSDTLADIRSETSQRLAAAGIELVWELSDDLPDPELDTARALHLHRIVREAISNVIRHARAARVRIRIKALGGKLLLDLTDDGGGQEPASKSRGRGVENMRERAAELAGDIDWKPGTEGGTKVLLTMPLGEDP